MALLAGQPGSLGGAGSTLHPGLTMQGMRLGRGGRLALPSRACLRPRAALCMRKMCRNAHLPASPTGAVFDQRRLLCGAAGASYTLPAPGRMQSPGLACDCRNFRARCCCPHAACQCSMWLEAISTPFVAVA